MIDEQLHQFYLEQGFNGGGEEFLLDGKITFAFELGASDFEIPGLQDLAGNRKYLLINNDLSEFADEIPEDTDHYDEDEELLNPRDDTIATLRILKNHLSESEMREILEELNKVTTDPITWEEIVG